MDIKKRLAFVFGTWFGAGRSPFAPGTAGSLVALPFGWLIMLFSGLTGLIVAAIVVYIAGTWAARVVMDDMKVEDPGLIVIDEVVGQWIVLMTAPFTLAGYLAAFALFRLFDITKPWPACWADSKLHSATGVMLDDVFAGMYGALILFFIPHQWLGFLPF